MSLTSSRYSFGEPERDNLIAKIWEKGHRLRNAMVQSILKHDPFNTDVLNCASTSGVLKSRFRRRISPQCSISNDTLDISDEKVNSFLKGDLMNRKDELEVCETLKTMSEEDLCRTTNLVYKSDYKCSCNTCLRYDKEDFTCDIVRSNDKNYCKQYGQGRYLNLDGNKPKVQLSAEVNELMKYTDCLRVTVQELVLNEKGKKKVTANLNLAKNVPVWGSQTFFIEYELPFILSVSTHRKTTKKMKSIEKNNSFIRICARRLSTEACFKGSPESKLIEDDKFEHREHKNRFPEGLNHNLCEEIHRKKIPFSNLKHNLKNDKVGTLVSNQIFKEKISDAIISVDKAAGLKTSLSQDNITELIPILYQEDFLQKLRDNVMVIEFWEKFETKNILFGVTKLPLQQFYFAYRNEDVTRYLSHNKLPIITSDWWESISNPYTDELVGQVQVLVALGTEQQIKNLELERGFKVHFVRANFETPLQTNIKILNERQIRPAPGGEIKGKLSQAKLAEEVNYKGDFRRVRLKENYKKTVMATKDKAVQSDDRMNSDHPIKEKEVASKEQLSHLLNQIIAVQTQRTSVETGTNTDNVNELNANDMESMQKKKSGTLNTADSLFLPTTSVPTLEMEQSSFNSSKQYQNAPPLVRSTSDLLHSLQAALSIPSAKRPLISANRAITYDNNHEPISSNHLRTSFKAQIFIKQALHLPIRKKYRGKKSKGKMGKGDDNVKPSCYVTFETMPGLDLKMTPLVPKSTSPTWNYKCDVFLPAELLFNNEKRLIFKVWRKSTNTTMVPNLQSDLVIGFATIDLTVLLSGFPNVQGWFNIIDFSSKCNGQINIHATPLEDLAVFKVQKGTYVCSVSPQSTEPNETTNDTQVKRLYQKIHQELEQEPESELLSRALKRKFTELDEITQRLRLRLSYVTNDESDDENDEVADEFERDINSLSIEEDFDMANFDKDGPNINTDKYKILGIDCSGASSSFDTESSPGKSNSNSNVSLMIVPTHEEVTKEFEHTQESLSILDQQLLEGKQRIDTLLGKLSLISGDTNSFSSRYISGCSATNRSEPGCNDIDTEAILKDLDHHSRPNIHASTSFDNTIFERIYEVEKRNNSSSPSSGTSVISNTTEFRAAPDGQGTFLETGIRE